MSNREGAVQTEAELDVRPLRKPDKHPAIFATYAALPAGDSFVLINDHDPKHLRQEFEAEYPGSYGWAYLNTETRDWRIRIAKLTSTLPRVLLNTRRVVVDTERRGAAGAVWTLPGRDRDLDSAIVDLPPGGTIDADAGPEVDVLVHVLGGGGQLHTEADDVVLEQGGLVWLPRRSRRQFTAGPAGLRYLTVQQRRRDLVLQSGPNGADR